MTQIEQILNYLWSIAPEGATNSRIAQALDSRSHQGVYMTTQNLTHSRRIRGEQVGKIWTFYALDAPEIELAMAMPPPRAGLSKTAKLSPAGFESLARPVMCREFGVTDLPPGKAGSVPKEFDYVSSDGRIVGDAKYYTLVGGTGLPPAKFSIIAEHIWLLEKTGVQVTSRGLSSLSAAEKRLSPRTVLREIAAEKNLHEPVCRLQLNFSFKKLQML